MMHILEYTLMIAGLLTVLGSLAFYYRRTSNSVTPAKLVKGQIELDAREFLANRIGLYILVMGLLVRYVNQLS